MDVEMKYYEMFGEFPLIPITSNITDRTFKDRIKLCLKMGIALQDLYPDEYAEPDNVLI